MMPPLFRWSCLPVCLTLLQISAGCSSPTEVAKPEAAAEALAPEDGMTAVQIVERMVEVYRKADTYMDSAVFGQHFVRADDGVKRQTVPINVSVLLKRPDRFRIIRIDPTADGTDMAGAAVVASDGKQLEGAVSWLEPQRLRLPAPELATLDSVAPDPMLHKALFPVAVQDIFPQLALLLTPKDQTPWPLADRAGLALLPTKDIRSLDQLVPCYRVLMRTNVGPQVLWIAKESFLLLRMEMTNDELREQLYPNDKFTKFVWQFDFYDVQLDAPASRDLFRLTPAEDGGEPRYVTKFEEPPATDEEDEAEAEASEATEGVTAEVTDAETTIEDESPADADDPNSPDDT